MRLRLRLLSEWLNVVWVVLGVRKGPLSPAAMNMLLWGNLSDVSVLFILCLPLHTVVALTRW